MDLIGRMGRKSRNWSRRAGMVSVSLAVVAGIAVAVSTTAQADTAHRAATATLTGARPYVVGGEPASPSQFPWMVRLSMGCGGSVIAPRVVLTAAHCVAGTGATSGITATIGRTSLSMPGGEDITSTYVLRSPRYAQQQTVDWALVELAQPTTAPKLQLAAQGDTSVNAGPFTVIGWGATNEGGPQSDTLQYASVPAIDDTACAQSYPKQFKPATELCAGQPQGGVDTCQGDSGGPLVTMAAGHPVEVGIVSYGTGCARPGYPGVYGEVEAFSAEITSHLSPDGGLIKENTLFPVL